SWDAGSVSALRRSPTAFSTSACRRVIASILFTRVQSSPSICRRKFEGSQLFGAAGGGPFPVTAVPLPFFIRVVSGENLIVRYAGSFEEASHCGKPISVMGALEKSR